ncbi:MAG TPA: hypothetical protein PKW35_22310, partial [Nannocystaceae bacterium]|nr:hypothetical protein [Nannocystaceae bacterium]
MEPSMTELGPIEAIIDQALAEDLASGDVTTRVAVPAGVSARAHLIAKAPIVVCGIGLAALVFRRVDPKSRFEALVRDGESVDAGALLARVDGSAHGLLAAERTMAPAPWMSTRSRFGRPAC